MGNIFIKKEAKKSDKSKYKIIVFDEIGLADVSPHNPLKVLNRILDTNNLPVSFIGLTNWNLSVSKMSRMVYVARPDMTDEDLVTTANSILGVDAWRKELDIKPINSVEEMKLKAAIENFNLKTGLYEYLFSVMATSYSKLTQIENFSGCSNFHGSRDFYTLIKDFSQSSLETITVITDKSGSQTLEIQREELLKHFLITIGRNFSGKELRQANSSELIQQEVQEVIGQSKNAYKLAMGIKNINKSFAEGKTGLPNVFTYIRQNLTTKKSRPPSNTSTRFCSSITEQTTPARSSTSEIARPKMTISRSPQDCLSSSRTGTHSYCRTSTRFTLAFMMYSTRSTR